MAEAGATVMTPSSASGMLPDALPDDGYGHNHDHDLVQAARGGSGEAFDALYRRYAGEIEGFIAARVTDPELAADLTSQVFTKAFAALPRYQAGSFRGWLYAIARNAITDTWRRQRPTAPLERAELVPALD
ncbi:MAG: RNA polymerase sigma factor, partial [Thermomicrobiales bacterium]